MTITLICIGKTSEKYVSEGIAIYLDRIKHYCKFNLMEMDAGKGDEIQIRKKEGESLLNTLDDKAIDYIRTVSTFVRSLTFTQLVAAIYRAYPAMRERSVFQG